MHERHYGILRGAGDGDVLRHYECAFTQAHDGKGAATAGEQDSGDIQYGLVRLEGPCERSALLSVDIALAPAFVGYSRAIGGKCYGIIFLAGL